MTVLADLDDHIPKHRQPDLKAIAAALPPKPNNRPSRRWKKHGGPLDPILLSVDPRVGQRTAAHHSKSTRQDAKTRVTPDNSLSYFSMTQIWQVQQR